MILSDFNYTLCLLLFQQKGILMKNSFFANRLHLLYLTASVLTLVLLAVGLYSFFLLGKPKISVVMPVYNTEQYLNESISAVLNQTFKDFELILVNDGSTDNSLKIMKEFAQKDNRIKLIDLKENGGAGNARNEGIRHIRGKYTIFVDSDDRMYPQMLEKLYSYAQKNNLDITICLSEVFHVPENMYVPYQIVDEKTGLNYNLLQQRGLTIFSYKDIPNEFLLLIRKYVWNKLIKTSLIKDNDLQFDNIAHHNDSYFITMALISAERIGYITDRLYLYRYARNNASSVDEVDDMKSLYFTFVKIKDGLQKYGAYKPLASSLLMWLALAIPSEERLSDEKSKFYRNQMIILSNEIYKDIDDKAAFHNMQNAM